MQQSLQQHPVFKKRRGVLLFNMQSIIVQISLKPIPGSNAGVHKEAFFMVPFFQAALVEPLPFVLDNKRDSIVLQALLKEDQAAHTAICVLEGMDTFKSNTEGYNILKGLRSVRTEFYDRSHRSS